MDQHMRKEGLTDKPWNQPVTAAELDKDPQLKQAVELLQHWPPKNLAQQKPLIGAVSLNAVFREKVTTSTPRMRGGMVTYSPLLSWGKREYSFIWMPPYPFSFLTLRLLSLIILFTLTY